MAYKNSDGNTGARAEFYNWKYFNSSLKRLEDYKPSNINVNTQLIKPKPEADWMGLIDASMRNYQNVKDVKTAFNAKKLEKLEKITNEFDPKEWDTKFKEAGIDMTSDKLALDYKAYQTGRIVEGLARQDFIENRVNKGEFKDKTPWEIDLAYKQYVTESVGLLGDNFKGISENDWFRKGAFGEGIKSREGIIGKALLAQKDQNGREFQINTVTNFTQGMAQGKSAEELYNNWKAESDIGFALHGDQGNRVVTDGIISKLGGEHNGYKYIAYLMDKPAPGYGGKTFKEVYGETALIASARKSLGIEAEMSQREHLEFISSLQPDVESGNVKAVREKYEEYKKRDLERSGDPSYMSKESADLLKLLDKTGHNYRQIQKREAEKRERELQAQLQLAEKNALKAAQLAEKELQAKTQILKERSWTYEGVNLLKQSNDMNIDTFMKQTGMNWNKFNDYYDQLNQLGLISFEDHVKIAQNQTIPRGQNPALKMMKQVNNSAMSTVGKLVDGMFYKTDVPPQEIPKELAQAVDLFNKIGYAEYQATTDADDDTVSAIEAISRAQAEGGAYTDVIKNRAAEQMKKQQDKTYDSRKTLEINKMVKSGLFTGYDFPMDGRAQTAIAQETVAIMRNNSWDSKKAGQQAYDNFWKKNDSVFGATVPKSTFSPSNGFPEGSLEFVQKFIKSEVEQGQVQGLQGFFNQNSQTFSIVDIGTLEVKKSWTVDELRKIAQEEHGIDLMQRQYDKYGLTEQVKKDMEEKGYELDSFKKVKPKGKSRREFKAWSEKPSVLHDHEVDLSSNTGTGD